MKALPSLLLVSSLLGSPLVPGLGRAAAATPHAIETLPTDKLAAMGPMLRTGEIALIESETSGRLKQVTIMALVAAPPQLVREVVTTPEKWPQFVPNVTRSRVVRHPDGSFDFDFALSVTLLTLTADNHVSTLPDGTVEFTNNDPKDPATQRWVFLPVAGGTLMVQYGFTDLWNAGAMLRSVVESAPLTEHGMAFAALFAYVRSFKQRAEKLAAKDSFSPFDPSARGPGFGFLLERGRVAVIRGDAATRITDVAVMERVAAPAARVGDVIAAPGEYAKFMDGVRKAEVRSETPEETDYWLQHDLSAVRMETRFRMHRAGNVIDVVGDEGDQKKSHYRWDLTQRGTGRTEVVFRANQDLAAASPLIFGTLFRAAPFFEPGAAVTMGLIYVAGVRARAEGRAEAKK